jgi:hypothetical protein
VEIGSQKQREDARSAIDNLLGSLSNESPERPSAQFLKARVLHFLGGKKQTQESARVLRRLIRNPKIDVAMKGRCAAELDMLISRHLEKERDKCWNPAFDKLVKNNLYAIAYKDHREGYKRARGATTTLDLQTAIRKFNNAADLRLHLGAFKDRCSSVNVMGTFGQKLAEWRAWESPELVDNALIDAIAAHEKSLAIAEDLDYQWEKGQAHLGLAVLKLRIARFTGSEFVGDLVAARRHRDLARKALQMNRDEENRFLSFLDILIDIAVAPDLSEAAKIGIKKFGSLVGQNLKGGRPDEALTWNLKVCEAIDNPGVPLESPPPLPSWLSAYWQERARRLQNTAKDRTSLTQQKLSQLLFDPFFPE